jgi:competence protein ComEA
MFYSLIIKLGMFAATMGVVFWIGWTLPTTFDREHNRLAESFEGPPEAEVSSDSEHRTTESHTSVASLTDQAPTAAASKRFHQGLLDLNRATDKDFDALPGVGPKLAEQIMKYRESVGIFRSRDEVRAVKGIGKKKFERIRPLVTVTPDAEFSERQKKAT